MPPLSGFKDHFSGHAGRYAAHRPGYPDALFEFIAGHCPVRDFAWDCGTGNGQAARSLTLFFRRVLATDASSQQVASARPVKGVDFRVARAEASGLEANSVDLVTVAQALHWFDIDAFMAEATRVLKPGGILAVWCYHYCRVNAGIDAVLAAMAADVDAYWPPERALVENRYRDIRLPCKEIPAADFSMQARWSASQLLDYLRTWSASQRYLAATGADPVQAHAERLHAVWGDGSRLVRWPIILRLGRK